MQGGELTPSDGGFARANLRPILRCECLGGFVYQELQEPVRCREFLVRKQIYQLVKDFFGAHSLILTPGLRRNLFRAASLWQWAEALRERGRLPRRYGQYHQSSGKQ